MKNYIFDLDGTLWDASCEIAKAWNQVFERHEELHRVFEVSDIIGVLGKSMEEVANTLLPDLSLKERNSIFLECCEEEVLFLRKHGGQLYPYVEETLQKLATNNHLYIVSNCQKGYIEAFMDHHGLRSYFKDTLCCGDTGFEKAENIVCLMERNGIKEAVYVGDTPGDFEAAKKAGIPFIHAAYGFGKLSNYPKVIEGIEELS